MSLSSASRPRAQVQSFTFPQLLALGAAALLGSASVVTNVSSAIARQPDLSGQIVGGSIALAVALLATIGLAASLQALARKQYALSALAALAFVLSAAFSVSSALGILGGARLQSVKTVEHSDNERVRIEFERRNAVTELSTVAPARNAAEITPEIARRLAVHGVDGCVSLNGPISKQHCPVISDLQSELARTNRRSALAGLIAQHDRDLAAIGAPTIANKDAAAIAHVLAAIGFNVKADAINTALMILGVVVLEIGASLSLATAKALRVIAEPSLRDITPAAHNAPLESTASVPAIVAPASVPAISEPAKGLAGEIAAKVRAMAESNGGVIQFPSKRQMASALNTSTGTACRALAVLATSGAIIASDAGNVVVKLAA